MWRKEELEEQRVGATYVRTYGKGSGDETPRLAIKLSKNLWTFVNISWYKRIACTWQQIFDSIDNSNVMKSVSPSLAVFRNSLFAILMQYVSTKALCPQSPFG